MWWQRIKELNLQGPDGLKGQLTTAIDLLTGSFMHQALAGAGPFTLFLMVDSAFSNLTQEEVRNRLNQLCTASAGKMLKLILSNKLHIGGLLHANFPSHLNSVMLIFHPCLKKNVFKSICIHQNI